MRGFKRIVRLSLFHIFMALDFLIANLYASSPLYYLLRWLLTRQVYLSRKSPVFCKIYSASAPMALADITLPSTIAVCREPS